MIVSLNRALSRLVTSGERAIGKHDGVFLVDTGVELYLKHSIGILVAED